MVSQSDNDKAHPRSYYDILGVDHTASEDEIKDAYRRLALIYHPDRQVTSAQKLKAAFKKHASHVKHEHVEQLASSHTEEEGESLIRELNIAYDTLSDKESRDEYDRKFMGEAFAAGVVDDNVYVRMTPTDLQEKLSHINTPKRYTARQYNSYLSNKAPPAIGRLKTSFNERKQFRASRLPSTHSTVAWMAAFPVVVCALWGFNWAVASQRQKQREEE